MFTKVYKKTKTKTSIKTITDRKKKMNKTWTETPNETFYFM